MVLEVLRRYPLFSLLEPPWLADWLNSAQIVKAALGETLLRAGTAGEYLFLLQEGRVRVLRVTKEGGESSVGTFGAGELFGEYALLPPGLNTATCRACFKCRLLRLPLPPLRQALADRSDIWPFLKRWLRLHALLSLQRCGPFQGFMSASSLQSLVERLATVRFKAARTIQADVLSADTWFVIVSGQVGLHPSAAEPSAEPMVLSAGEGFGARAPLDGSGLPLAVAHGDSECLALRRADFFGSRRGPPSLQTGHSQFRRMPKVLPWLGQQEAIDCGAASLAMVARFHGQVVSLAEVRQRLVLGPRGASLLDLHQAALVLGFRSQPVRVGFEQLGEMTLPAIAHLHHDHYVVLYTYRGDGFVIGDPAAGVVNMDWARFRQAWTGNLLLLPGLARSCAAAGETVVPGS